MNSKVNKRKYYEKILANLQYIFQTMEGYITTNFLAR